MKKWRRLSLNLKLLACFFAAIFVLSIFHIASYLRLLNTMTAEAQASANERMSSAAIRLDEAFARIRNGYFALTYTPAFRQATRSASPGGYELVDLSRQAALNLKSDEEIYAFAILFRGSSQVVTSNGNYLDTDFFSRFYTSEEYTAAFWQEEKQAAFSQRSYAAAAYTTGSPIFSTGTMVLMPLAFKSYWNSNAMVLMLLDVGKICRQADAYLSEDFYIFGPQGQLLFSTQAQPALTAAPERDEPLYEMPDGQYIAQQVSPSSGFTYVKMLPKSIVVGQITSSLNVSLITALAALVLGIAIAVISVWRLMHPVQEILRLFPGGGARAGTDELRTIQTNVEQMLRQREQYVQQLSKKDAALSGFLLQSQLKNIYVELDTPEKTIPAEACTFYILYLRIHYRQGALDGITAEPPAVAHMFLENLQQTLNRLFATALIFQLEPNQFVAKVSLPAAAPDIATQIEYLLQRLDNEREFAFFTVVQSGPLAADGDFTAVYGQVLDAAQYALVESRTQLLHLPLSTEGLASFSFPAEQEQRLRALIRDGKADEARALAGEVIQGNLARGIPHAHMFLLCSALASAAMRALAGLQLAEGVPGPGSSAVMGRLPHCDTGQDYRDLLTGFVASAAQCAARQTPGEDPVLQGVQLFLEENYQRDFSMDELADALHLSKSYLSTYYKGKTGGNLSGRIQFFRIEKAIELLANKDLRVGDIGAMVGIGNINTFLRQFKKYTGTTPKEYRIRMLSMRE